MSRDYARVAIRFAQAAAKDEQGEHTCRWVRLAAQRFLADLERTKQESCGFLFSRKHARHVCAFMELLPHVEGTWATPTLTLEPAQIFVLACLFGFRRKADGYRRFNTAYLEMARKNAKSAIAGGIALYTLCCEDEPGPQVKTAATTGEQARIVFDVAKKMSQKKAQLREAFSLTVFERSIVCEANGGNIRPINSKASTQDGLNPHCAILDELHAHKTRDLFDVLRSARGARKNPLSLYITTAGYNTNGPCYKERTFVTKVLEGIIDADHYFGIIFTLDDESEISDPTKWIKANPLLGITVQPESIAEYITESQGEPEKWYELRTKVFSLWTNAVKSWIQFDTWKLNDGKPDLEDVSHTDVYGGLDLASTVDMCAFWLAWWGKDGHIHCWGRYYVPRAAVEPRTDKQNIPYKTWVEQGFLVATPGNVTDYDFILEDVKAALKRFRIKEIAYDPWNASYLVTKLTGEGAPMLAFRQGPASYHPAMQAFERAYLKHEINHGQNPILSWNASNIIARHDVNRNMAPDREHSQEKIDGMVALLMAVGRLSAHGPPKQSKYETEGLMVLG